MFELLFKYPASLFSKGTLVLAGGWPVWLLPVAILAAAAALGYGLFSRSSNAMRGLRGGVVWLLQTLLVVLVLLMLWRPALSVATLKPQQNIVAVVVDDSRSMSIRDGAGSENGPTRSSEARRILDSGLLKSLQERFQVRLYRLGENVERIRKTEDLQAKTPATHIGENLRQVAAEASNLPVGAIVLLSDGADNAGGIDLETISEIRRQRIPVHTIGFGREQMTRDLELLDAIVPARALANSRLSADVTFHQRGYAQRKAKLVVRQNGASLATREITLKSDGTPQNESIVFNVGEAGVKNLEIGIDPLDGEENIANNKLTRLVNADATKQRILYLEGEPRWEYKFLRRAVEDDKSLEVISILRTTQNKIYRQGISSPNELEQGFPTKVEDLFAYQGLILGSVEANYLSPAQQELIKQFVDRRGGGLLFLGGRTSLGDGGYGKAPFVDLLPVLVPDRKGTFVRDPANVQLTQAGRDSLITRIKETPDQNAEWWAKKLPYLMNYQDPGTPKPGALVLAESIPNGGSRHLPLLITQNYGRGRTALFATGGSWRWQMQMPLEDMSHEVFWRQMLRWLVSDTHERVMASTPKQVIADESKVRLRAEVRDQTYLPASDAHVAARIIGPDGVAQTAELQPDPVEPGVYLTDWAADKPGSYVAEVIAERGQQETGRDVLTFRREDGVAESFHAEQNRELLEKLASQTGGRYYRASEADRLSKEISYSEAGITVRETKDLWDMPILFLLALLLRSGEWLLRRKWGVI